MTATESPGDENGAIVRNSEVPPSGSPPQGNDDSQKRIRPLPKVVAATTQETDRSEQMAKNLTDQGRPSRQRSTEEDSGILSNSSDEFFEDEHDKTSNPFAAVSSMQKRLSQLVDGHMLNIEEGSDGSTDKPAELASKDSVEEAI